MSVRALQERHSHSTTAQRFEAKYVISDASAERLLDYVAPYVASDPHTSWGVPYVITSLYFDDPKYSLYWSSRTGEKNRFKLRIRRYNDATEGPVFFEVKRRVNQVILKERALVRGEAMAPILRGEPVSRDAFVKGDPRDYSALASFRALADRMDAAPQAMVRYSREAYVSAMEEAVRVTFDRHLGCLPSDGSAARDWRIDPHWTGIEHPPVILEIKFTDVFPAWLQRAVARFNMRQTSFAKYCACLEGMKRNGVVYMARGLPAEDPLWSSVL